jgi:carboxylesterase
MPELIPGAEPWSAAGGEVGVLLLHGFTSTPLSVLPVAEALAAAGISVEVPRLPGHGTHWKELQRTRWRDWVRESVAAFEQLKARTERRVVFGQSLGAALALYLAETRDDLDGVVVVNPSVYHKHPLKRLLPVLKWVVPAFPAIGNDIAKPGADEKPYSRAPLKAASSVFEFHDLVRRHLADVTVPVLVFTSRQDHLVPVECGDMVVDGVSTADVERVWLERSYHVACLDYDADEIAERTLAFARRVAAGTATA